jgi:NADPH2:quinone reductase
MKALVYEHAHTLENFAIKLVEVEEPTLRGFDVLVSVQAVGINPGETWIRRTRSAEPGGRVLLGGEFAGIVVSTAPGVTKFKVGDRVFGTGDMSRDGAWAERLAVDHRILSKIPKELSFTDAASLPIAALSAWETIFRDQDTLPVDVNRVLIVGGAGGVGSVATQLLKAKTSAYVIATASRPESKKWCLEMGADLVIDHTKDIESQLASTEIPIIDFVLSTANTVGNLGWIARVLRPFGHVALVDIAPSLDMSGLMLKSASIHTEIVFSRIMHGYQVHRQGEILEEISALVSDKRLRPIATTRLNDMTAETMKTAHGLLESSLTIGKVVITTG